MDKIFDALIAGMIFLLFLFFIADAKAEVKSLTFQFNDNVMIVISNLDCKIPEINKQKYPYMNFAVKTLSDGKKDYLFGCFTHDKDDIVIQWAGGDQSRFPANAFLQEK